MLAVYYDVQAAKLYLAVRIKLPKENSIVVAEVYPAYLITFINVNCYH